MIEPRRPLSPSSAVPIAAAALAAQGRYGTVTALAELHGVSRQHVYDLRERGRAALEAAFEEPTGKSAPGPSTLTLEPCDVERAVVALRVMTPASVRDIVDVLPELFDINPSYGTVWNILRHAEEQAAAFLRTVDLSAVETVALDEMFSQRRPVLAGIDLDTQYLFQLEVSDSRSGAAWASRLTLLRDEQGLVPSAVVKDAGTGLAAGVEATWPDAEARDDLFHATYLMGREAHRLERAAYQGIEMVETLVYRRERARTETDRRKFGQLVRSARDSMDAAIARYDGFEALRREAIRVLDLTDRGSGRLRTRAEVVETLTRVAKQMEALGSKRVRAVARYIGNRAEGLGRFLDDLGQRLDAVADELGDRHLVEAATRAWQATFDCHRGGRPWEQQTRERELTEATRSLRDATGHSSERLVQVVGAVFPELARRHRASSAIENFNSVLRPYLVVQKHAEQGFLNLFRFYWNTRTRKRGPFAAEPVNGLRHGGDSFI